MHYRSFLNRDYKSRSASGATRRPLRTHWRLRAAAFVAGSIVIGAVLAATHDGGNAPLTQPLPIAGAALEAGHDNGIQALGERVTLGLPLPPAASPATTPVIEAQDNGPAWEEIVVKRGDTLSSIFSRLEIHSQLTPVLALGEATRALTSVYPGQVLRVRRGEQGLQELVYDLSDSEHLRIWREGGELHAETSSRDLEVREARASGTIRYSLFEAGLQAGLSQNLIMELATIFGWDIDFALDIRAGDQFSVIYEEYYRDGEKLRDGRILAAEFINQGRAFRAAYYDGDGARAGYYSPDGRSMRKAFLRAPVDFHRISSRFQPERYHPVLGVKRPHRGVDYAARTGTPIKAAGDGKITFRGTKGGYGRTVIIQHGATYSTLYAHLSLFRGGVGVGTRVKQGQVIGYVGQSGLATGPHLHYEFLVNGVHRNPLTVKLPTAEPLPATVVARFQDHAEPLFAQLDTVRRVQLAQGVATP